MKTAKNNSKIGHMLINEHFMNDMKRIMRQDIIGKGYPEDAIDMEHVIYQFCVLYKRLIHNRPRIIYHSNVFRRPTDANLAAGLEALEAKIRSGEDINPHLSRTSKKIEYKDGMLFDWNIYHFHLGLEMESDNYSSRTGDVLYAYVTENAVYCLTIAPHGQWEDKELLEIIVRNWKKLLSKYEIDGEIETISDSKADIKAFRAGNINSMIKLSNGKTYVSMGGGFMTNGYSTSAMMSHGYMIRFVQMLKQVAYKETYRFFESLFGKWLEIPHGVIFPYVYQFILRRTSEERIGVVQVKEDRSEKLIYEHQFPSLKKVIYG